MLLLRGVLGATLGAVILTAAAVAPASTVNAGRVRTRPLLEARLLVEVNSLRVSRGLAPLHLNRELAAAAGQHSREMINRGYFAHDGAGSSYARRLQALLPGRRPPPVDRGRESRVGLADGRRASGCAAVAEQPETPREPPGAGPWQDVGISAAHARAAPGAFRGLDVTVITVDFGRRA